jgi:hypothetical protein
MGKLLAHKNRVLLLEWRGRMREAVELGVQVSLGWMKGHTARVEWPYPVQAWCDEFAVVANNGGAEVEERRASCRSGRLRSCSGTRGNSGRSGAVGSRS